MSDQTRIIAAFADILGIQVTDFDLESTLTEDLGVSPIEKADLFSGLAQKFNIVFEPAEIEGVKTVNSLVELVEDKLLES